MPAQSIRDQLIEIAARILDDEGPAAVTTRRLAKESGASTMAVYTHFGGMPELFTAVVQSAFDRFGVALRSVPATQDPGEHLFGLANAYRGFARANPHLYAVMFGDTYGSMGVNRESITGYSETFDVLVQAADQVINAGLFRPAPATLVASQLWTTVHGFVQLELHGLFSDTTTPTAEELWIELLTNQGRGLGAPL